MCASDGGGLLTQEPIYIAVRLHIYSPNPDPITLNPVEGHPTKLQPIAKKQVTCAIDNTGDIVQRLAYEPLCSAGTTNKAQVSSRQRAVALRASCCD